jgi:predicted nucleotidyltransferase
MAGSALRLSPLEADTVAALKGALAARFGERLRELVLFGSRARGDAHDESDIDVLVIIEAVTDAERRVVQDLGADLSVESGLVLSPIVRPPEWRARKANPLNVAIDAEGIAL